MLSAKSHLSEVWCDSLGELQGCDYLVVRDHRLESTPRSSLPYSQKCEISTSFASWASGNSWRRQASWSVASFEMLHQLTQISVQHLKHRRGPSKLLWDSSWAVMQKAFGWEPLLKLDRETNSLCRQLNFGSETWVYWPELPGNSSRLLALTRGRKLKWTQVLDFTNMNNVCKSASPVYRTYVLGGWHICELWIRISLFAGQGYVFSSSQFSELSIIIRHLCRDL